MKAALKIFVSRTLEEAGVLSDFLRHIDAVVSAHSLIDFSPMPFQFPSTQWLFFYSKKGVEYVIDQGGNTDIIKRYSIATFGASTAYYITNQYDLDVSYTGSSNAAIVATEINEIIRTETMCFVCGSKSLRSVQQELADDKNICEITVYDSQPRTDQSLSHYDIAILTSPMNVRTFVVMGGSADRYLAIGSTTQKALNAYNINSEKAHVASEEGLVHALKLMIKRPSII